MEIKQNVRDTTFWMTLYILVWILAHINILLRVWVRNSMKAPLQVLFRIRRSVFSLVRLIFIFGKYAVVWGLTCPDMIPVVCMRCHCTLLIVLLMLLVPHTLMLMLRVTWLVGCYVVVVRILACV